MSTESERRLHTRAEEDSARAGEPAGSEQYGETTDRRQEAHAGQVGETDAVQRDTATPIDDSERRPTSGDAVEPDSAARAHDPGAMRETTSAGQSATGNERAEFAGDAERGSMDASTQGVAQDSTRGADATASAPAASDQLAPLIPEADLDRLRTQWREVQVTFVDNPRAAVARADELLGGTIDQLVATYQERKRELDSRLGDESDTEGLRQALRGYRGFFDQLLSTGA
ncbi:hypothetical protein LTT66_29065 [Nocardia gipuzkoensis]|uniref:hypothetical protein n=1 Tax=Nocardia gipuzkoensis TaxID=2749991 RepID=UPI001E42FA38|nr:hypothetical protein [Nocardia gipuzkoensis]UGT67248.1 hypothetical protein LTT66_29065 [Nocardia gipuzkoensis]